MTFVFRDLGSGVSWSLKEGKSYTFGRDGDIKVPYTSVSRKHCGIIVKAQHILITERKLNNFTFVNGKKLNGPGDCVVPVGSKMLFGNEAEFILEKFEKLVVTTTGIPSAKKKEFKALMQQQAIEVVPEWQENVTHVVAGVSMLTKKVLYALINKQHIVQYEFFETRMNCLNQNKPLPKESDYYVTTLSGPFQTEINYSVERKEMLRDKVVVFYSAQEMEKLRIIVTMCGGKATTLGEKILTEKDLTGEREYLVVNTGGNMESPNWCKLLETLKKLNRRTIPAQEITTAVLAGSTKIFCNSCVDLSARLLSAKKPTVNGVPIVDDTQEDKSRIPLTKPEIIPATETMDTTQHHPVELADSKELVQSQIASSVIKFETCRDNFPSVSENSVQITDVITDAQTNRKRPAVEDIDSIKTEPQQEYEAERSVVIPRKLGLKRSKPSSSTASAVSNSVLNAFKNIEVKAEKNDKSSNVLKQIQDNTATNVTTNLDETRSEVTVTKPPNSLRIKRSSFNTKTTTVDKPGNTTILTQAFTPVARTAKPEPPKKLALKRKKKSESDDDGIQKRQDSKGWPISETVELLSDEETTPVVSKLPKTTPTKPTSSFVSFVANVSTSSKTTNVTSVSRADSTTTSTGSLDRSFYKTFRKQCLISTEDYRKVVVHKIVLSAN